MLVPANLPPLALINAKVACVDFRNFYNLNLLIFRTGFI